MTTTITKGNMDNQDDDVVNKQSEIEFGKPYQKYRKLSKFKPYRDSIVVTPVEIEIDCCLYNMIDREILENIRPDGDKMSFEEWVNICFKERMDQILTDPKEFGKLILGPLRQAYCLPEADIKEKED
jgi:hypothetical protein